MTNTTEFEQGWHEVLNIQKGKVMNDWKIDEPDDVVQFERLSLKDRSFLINRLTDQFTVEAAIQLYDIGSMEEKGTLARAPTPEQASARLNVEMVPSARADWEYFSVPLPRSDALLQSAVRILRSKAEPTGSAVLPGREEGFLLRHEHLRIVYRHHASEGRIVIYAIGCRGISPLAKIWRYFDQGKALDLLERNELYLRRLDLLTDEFEGDPYEGTPTFNIFERYKQMRRQYLGPADDAELMLRFQQERQATFVSCWQKSENESWLMWKQYCRRGGGFAVQTTLRRLNHLFAARARQYEILFLRPVVYIDHWSDDPLPHTVPVQVFLKPVWFSEEREIRLARFHFECAYAGTLEQCKTKLQRLKDHERIPIDLADFAENVVWNPFCTEEHRKAMLDLVRSKRPCVEQKLRESRVRVRPVVWPGTGSSGRP